MGRVNKDSPYREQQRKCLKDRAKTQIVRTAERQPGSTAIGRKMQLPTPANDNGPLGRIYTFEETAGKLHVSRRSLQGIIKRHPLFAKNGKVYLFFRTGYSINLGGNAATATRQT
jgi:hypothetical protein